MAYIVDIYRFNNSIEYEFKWKGNYGAKGEKRAARQKATPEQIKKQNQKQKEKYTRRLIKLNFSKNDIWCTFLYPKGTRKGIEEVKDDFKRFLRRLRTKYKARDSDLKFIYRIEVGSKGGIHIHMLCNHIEGSPPIDTVIQELWTHGRVNFQRFGGQEEDCEKLAEYIVKMPTDEAQKQIEELYSGDSKALIAYSSSRNLLRPVAERKEYKRRTLRKIIDDGIQPTKGYQIKKDSVYIGINQFTGMSYIYYTEIKDG